MVTKTRASRGSVRAMTTDRTPETDVGLVCEIAVNGHTVRLDPPVAIHGGDKIEDADPRLLATLEGLLRGAAGKFTVAA